jgi:CubicO group peptidase (beta-lactamase class C family)
MSDTYYPPPESKGGWRWLSDGDEIVEKAGMDPAKLAQVQQLQEFLHGSESWGIAIIRHGYLVREFYTFNVWPTTRFDVWSCTKTFTGAAWGLLLDDSRHDRLPGKQKVTLDSTVYDVIPEGYPLTDPRKARILIQHLLTMTSGIAGEDSGVIGMPTTVDQGPFEHALGYGPNRYGKWVKELVAEPGTHWEYSDPAFVHLSLAFARIAGREMSDYLSERVLSRIGIEQLSWDLQGGRGFLGPHTNAHSGVHVSARELARFGYLCLHRGVWAGEHLIPDWWIELSTQTSQELNPAYGYTWWVNTQGARWPHLPRDAFALEGYRSNRCYVIPSLDLVVARVGSGPPTWNEGGLIGGIVSAIAD